MSWLAKAVILGLSFFIAIMVIKPIGVSTQFSVLSGRIHKMINPDIIWEDKESEYGYASSNEYYNENGGKLARAIENIWNYDFIFVLAIPLGSLVASIIYKKNTKEDSKSYHNRRSNRSFFKEYGPACTSGFLLLYGARMADGCTSGHMMSGIMQGSVSGYLFAISAFIIAIPTAFIVDKVRNKRIL